MCIYVVLSNLTSNDLHILLHELLLTYLGCTIKYGDSMESPRPIYLRHTLYFLFKKKNHAIYQSIRENITPVFKKSYSVADGQYLAIDYVEHIIEFDIGSY